LALILFPVSCAIGGKLEAKGRFLGRFTYEDRQRNSRETNALKNLLSFHAVLPSVSIFVSFGRFRRGMKTRAIRPPVQLGLSLPCVRRRQKRPGFEDFKRLQELLAKHGSDAFRCRRLRSFSAKWSRRCAASLNSAERIGFCKSSTRHQFLD